MPQNGGGLHFAMCHLVQSVM